MATEIDYAAVLADLEAKRAAIDAAITGVRQMMNLSTEQVVAPVNGSERRESTEVRFDSFFRMPMPRAIVKFLEMAKTPQSVGDITKALLDGGFKTTSKNFMPTVGSNLSRMKATGELVNVEGKWGLASWYPAARKADQAVTPKEGRKRGRPRKTTAPSAQPTATKEQPSSKLTEQQIFQIGRLNAEGKSLNEIARELHVHHLKIMNSKVWRVLHPRRQDQTPAAA
jgi:hypothetical protein